MSVSVHTPRLDPSPLFDGISRLAASSQFARWLNAPTRVAVNPPAADLAEAAQGQGETARDAWGAISQDWVEITQDWAVIIQDWGKVTQDAGAAWGALIQELTPDASAPEREL